MDKPAARIALIIVGALVAVALGAGVGYMLFAHKSSPNDAASQPPAHTEPKAAATSEQAPAADPKQRPEKADLPAEAEPVNDAARSGQPAGDFNNVYKSGPTSDEFAVSVRDAWVHDYLVGDRVIDRDVTVASSVTGQSYTMTCADKGSYVHCTGGNDANVYIS